MIKKRPEPSSSHFRRALAATIVNGIFATALGAMLWVASGQATTQDHLPVRPTVTIAVIDAP